MAAAPERPADLEWVHTLKQGGAFPFKDSPLCSHAWASPPGNNFFIRGPHYLDTKSKIPGGEPLLQPIAFDLLKSSSKISNIMRHPQCRVRAALHAARDSANPPVPSVDGVTAGDDVQEPFVWAFNLQLPSKENHSLVMYYASFRRPEKGSLMQRFLDGDDAFRNERLKLLTSIPQGPRLVKLVVREKGAVCMIGKFLSCTYTREKDYMEVDVDVGSHIIARTVFQVCAGLAGLGTTEFAFVFEGRYQHELPERIVGTLRLANLDFSVATSIDCPQLSHEIMNKDKHKASYKGIWKSWRRHVQQADDDEEKLSDGNNANILPPL